MPPHRNLGSFILMLFPIYVKGIKNTQLDRYITFEELHQLIQNGSHKGHVETIRLLKSNRDDYYKSLKETLPYITPHVKVKQRNLSDEEFDKNFICTTGFMYFDIDNVADILNEKQRIINKYRNQVSMVCISPSGAGLTLLFRVTNDITRYSFQQVWNTIKATILKDEKIDTYAKGLIRPMFLSHDEEVYVNYNNIITVELVDEKIGVDPITISSYNKVKPYFSGTTENTSTQNKYQIYSIDEVLATIKTKTIVAVNNPVVEFREEMVLEPYIPNMIVDGKKHKTYYTLLHQWYYLNQDVPLDYIFSYLFYINNTRAKPKMDMKELRRMFNSVIDKIKETGVFHIEPKPRRVHWNLNNKELTGKIKETIAKSLNGAFERHTTISKIQQAKKQLELEGKKITNRAIAKMIEMDVSTVGKRIKDKPVDMGYEVSLWN